jgi:glycosyltransferase involved in cell wall biosynthesis
MKASIVVISKDEERLADTLDALAGSMVAESALSIELLVVDGSEGRLDHIRRDHPDVRWVDFPPVDRVTVTIPHQRNAGVGHSVGDVIVFIDAGCVPAEGWLEALIDPIRNGGEAITSGKTGGGGAYASAADSAEGPGYLSEAPTINLAMSRSVFDAVGRFDESFAYGSDVDFTWRAVHLGYRIKYVPEAGLCHDWGDLRRRLRRARQYGVARSRLYRKHPQRIYRALRHDPVPFVYPLWLLGLPIAVRRPAYLALLLVPLWRARKHAAPIEVVVSHVLQGAGCLEEAAGHLFRRFCDSLSGGGR